MGLLFGYAPEIAPVFDALESIRQGPELFRANEPHAIRDLFDNSRFST
jgi:hypothetical protein